jgi:energy-coupling factor transporter transmembrane protein EcfT
LPQKIYYIKADFTATYTGKKQGMEHTLYKRAYTTSFHDVVLENVEPLPEFNTNAYRIGNDFIENLSIDGVHIKIPANEPLQHTFVKANIREGILRNPVISENSKSGNNTFGKVSGTIYAKIIREFAEPLATETAQTYTQTKQIHTAPSENKTISPVNNIVGSKKGSGFLGCLSNIFWIMCSFSLLSAIFRGFHNWLLFSAIVFIVVGIFFGLALFFSFLRRVSSIFSFLLAFIFIFILLSYFYSYTGHRQKDSEATVKHEQDEQSETSSLRKDTTMAQNDPAACADNPLVAVHKRAWVDFIPHRYEGKLVMSQCFFNQSRENREAMNPTGQQIYSFYNNLYAKLAMNDRNKMDLVYQMFDSIRNNKGLNQAQFADMVVTCVQDIPYRLVIDNPSELDGRMLQLYREQGALEHIKFGVQAPAEFMYNLQGDCDTRALFCYTVLDHFGYDAAILISQYYAHAILGLAIPSTGASLSYRGKRYYTWETTAKGFQLGQMSPECNNMHYWNIVLANH